MKQWQMSHIKDDDDLRQNKKNDAYIMATAEDALNWKLRTQSAGYYNDPFMQCLYDAKLSNRDEYGSRQQQHQQPIMRRGTYARVCCIDRAIAQFVSLGGKQVVVLGAGKDCCFGRMRRNILTTKVDNHVSVEDVIWCDVDLQKVIENKQRLLRKSYPEIFNDNKYILKAWDLREDPEILIKFLIEQGFDINTPILFIMECVLMYLPNDSACILMKCLSNHCDALLLAIYDPIIKHDRFGQVMAQHLTNARIMDKSLGMNHTPTIEKHIERLHSTGYQIVVACDMLQAYDTIISNAQRINANKTEMLDELEEWRLIMSHYTFIVAASIRSNRSISFVKNYVSIESGSPLGFMTDHCTYSNIS